MSALSDVRSDHWCPTGKIGYESRHRAMTAANRIRNEKRRRKHQTRAPVKIIAYLCDACGAWHLSRILPPRKPRTRREVH